MNRKNTLNYPKSAAMGFFSKGLKNEFETALVNEPSVFEPLNISTVFASPDEVDLRKNTHSAVKRILERREANMKMVKLLSLKVSQFTLRRVQKIETYL